MTPFAMFFAIAIKIVGQTQARMLGKVTMSSDRGLCIYSQQ